MGLHHQDERKGTTQYVMLRTTQSMILIGHTAKGSFCGSERGMQKWYFEGGTNVESPMKAECLFCCEKDNERGMIVCMYLYVWFLFTSNIIEQLLIIDNKI